MAAGGGKSVLLGFVDDYMTSDSDHYYTNKIGGSPDWPDGGGHPPPQCGQCGMKLVLISQIYAPLSSLSGYHRTLYLFSCLQPPCWNKPGSWVCLRSQILDTTKSTEVSATAKPAKDVNDWLNDADDWGDDNDVNGNDDFGCSVPTSKVQESQSTNIKLPSINNLHVSDRNTNLNETKQQTGAESVADVTEAVAEIEMEQDDSNITVDMPEIASDTNIPNLFAVANRDIKEGMKIVPFYIWVEEESGGQEPEVTEHEQRLINEYKAREAVENVQSKSKSSSGGPGTDSYERSVPCHGDEYFHKFLSVIGHNPGQILRYGRLCPGEPLLLRPLQEKVAIMKCQYCGAELVFEYQLLPSLVSQMSVLGVEGSPVEFGTVLVFTCSQSCWSSQDSSPRRETVILQQEAM